MSLTTIDPFHRQAWVDQFTSGVRILSQQRLCRIAIHIDNVGENYGDDTYVKRMPPEEIYRLEKKYETSVPSEMAVDLRKLNAHMFLQEKYMDITDRRRFANNGELDPAIVETLVAAMNRRMDILAVDAALGEAIPAKREILGTSITTGTPIALPATQKIGADGKGLTFDKLLKAKKKFENNNVGIDDPQEFIIVIGPEQAEDLRNIKELRSQFYVSEKVTETGNLPPLAGLGKPVIFTRLPKTSAGERRCLVFAKKAMGKKELGPPAIDLAQNTNLKGNPWKWTASLELGFTRLEEVGVVEILCSEAANRNASS